MIVMRVNTEVTTFTRITQIQWLQDKLAPSKAVLDEQVAYLAEISHRTLKGLTQSINPDRPPKNYKDASSREDKQEWAEAYMKVLVHHIHMLLLSRRQKQDSWH